MVMCRLRQGFPEDHLAQLFNVSASTVRRIFVTWVNFMFFKFGQINIWPSRKVIDTMPKSFKGRYKSTRVIIDCTEVRCQMPSSLQLNWELFSAYKNHTTLKGKPFHTTQQKGNATDQTAPSQTPIYAYRETPFISSRAKLVANITSEARHDSYMIEQKNTWPTTTRR